MDTRDPSFGEALRFWLKLGFISFGGPAGQIAIMHTELVDRKRWIGEERFLHALNFCMLLPGPEATQLAIYCGWLLHRTWGGIVAGVLFVLPAAVLLWGFSYVYVVHGNLPWVAAIFYGLKPAVTAIVAAAVIKIGRRALKTAWMWALAAIAFGLIYLLRVPFPLIIAGAALIGWFAHRGTRPAEEAISPEMTRLDPRRNETGWGRAAKVCVTCAVLWAAPILVAGLTQGWRSTLVREGMFFSKAAMVTFGGAYAVLPYVAQHAVGQQSWLSAPQMLDGLGLAETTPGPLIMVVQFVGFLGGWNHPGGLQPIWAATLGAAITTWTTFVPCFLWILLGAPHMERLRRIARLNSALAAVTAAVVGVVLNLAVWFCQQTVWPGGALDGFALLVAIAAFVGLTRFRIPVITIVIASGMIGLLFRTWVPGW
ncbi:MAG: chromate efflux transporter [Opitutus sp.]